MAKNQSTAMIDKEIKKEMGKLGIKEKLDPVGKADGDIDNDGDKDDSDKYLAKRRKAISKAIANEDLEKDDEKTVKDVVKGLKKAVKTHQGQVKSLTKDIQDETNLEEGKMKELHGYIAKGMSAQQISKKMNVDVKTIETLMKEDTMNKNVEETLDLARQANVAKQKSMREILADIWNMNEGKSPFDLKEAASVFISSFEKGDANMKDSKKYTDAIKKYGLKSNFVSTASKNGHEVTGRNINDITKFLSDFFGKDEFKDRFKKKGNSYEDMDEGFSSDAQRKAAFASGYKEKDKKESKTATGEKPTKVELDPKVK
jgi:hypothetical protein